MSRRLRLLDGDQPLRRRPRRLWPAAALALALGVAVVGWRANLLPHGVTPAGSRSTSLGAAAGVEIPSPSHLTHLTRLLPEPTRVPASSSYRFLQMVDGHPATFEPCRAIHYVVHRGEEPAAFDRLFRDAVARVSSATGLKFVDDGTTSELPLAEPTERLLYQPALYGDRWAPVLVAWSNSAESGAELAGREAGFGGPDLWGQTAGSRHYVTGEVALNLPDLDSLAVRPQGTTLVEDVMLHELGHLVGLGHAPEPSQVMFWVLRTPHVGYQAGDLAGLARLGGGPCYQDY